MPTASEIATGRDAPLSQGLFYALQTRAPLFSAFDFRTSTDTRFKSLALVSLPDSKFVDYGEGFAPSNARFELRDFECSLIGGQVSEELITSRQWDRRHPGLSWRAIQTQAKIEADILNVERQMIKGSANDGKGFPGAKEMTPFIAGNVLGLTDEAEDHDYERSVIDAGGTSANEASSVYSFVFGEMDCQGILGSDQTSEGELFHVGEPVRQMIATDPNKPGETLEHRIFQLHGYVGLSVSGFNKQKESEPVPVQYSLRRLANVTTDNGATLDDAKMEQLATSHGVGKFPSLFAMSARSGRQLANSRAATSIVHNLGIRGDARNATGSIQPRRPDEWEGVRIVYPQPAAIGNGDAIEAV